MLSMLVFYLCPKNLLQERQITRYALSWNINSNAHAHPTEIPKIQCENPEAIKPTITLFLESNN